MTDAKISLRQLMTILFLTLLPLGTERLPGRLSGQGSCLLCPLLAGGVAVVLALW